jgi:conjugal transfer pilus assembly protein TraU
VRDKNFKFIFFIFFSLLFIKQVHASCHGSFVNPITDICWSCLFPMSIGSVLSFGGNMPDTDNPDFPICVCPGTPPVPGIAIGFWEPIAVVDITRHPGCMVNLGGIEFPIGSASETGYAESADSSQTSSFYYAHWYHYPLLIWLEVIIDALCLEKDVKFDLGYLTEIDPMWDDDEVSLILNPEAVVFANPIAQVACAADAIKSTVGLPMDTLFWCAGSHGSMYPLNGHVQEHVGGVAASTLLAERMVYKLHRELILKDSSPDLSHICRQHVTPILPKSRYRYQMVNPLPTTGSKGCFPFGRTTAIWGSMKEFPYKGEDFGYLIWRKRNCCAL